MRSHSGTQRRRQTISAANHRWVPPNKIAAGNRHRTLSFDETMKCGHHLCSQRQSPVAVPELWRSFKPASVAPTEIAFHPVSGRGGVRHRRGQRSAFRSEVALPAGGFISGETHCIPSSRVLGTFIKRRQFVTRWPAVAAGNDWPSTGNQTCLDGGTSVTMRGVMALERRPETQRILTKNAHVRRYTRFSGAYTRLQFAYSRARTYRCQ